MAPKRPEPADAAPKIRVVADTSEGAIRRAFELIYQYGWWPLLMENSPPGTMDQVLNHPTADDLRRTRELFKELGLEHWIRKKDGSGPEPM